MPDTYGTKASSFSVVESADQKATAEAIYATLSEQYREFSPVFLGSRAQTHTTEELITVISDATTKRGYRYIVNINSIQREVRNNGVPVYAEDKFSSLVENLIRRNQEVIFHHLVDLGVNPNLLCQILQRRFSDKQHRSTSRVIED